MINIELLKEKIESTDFSGIVSIHKKGQTVLEITKGYLDWANQIPINRNTRFGIASGTKLFTALGIMRLVEEGKCQLDDLAFEYIPVKYSEYDQSITIRHLMTHMSGIPDYLDEDKIDDFGSFFVEKPWYALEKPSDYLSIMPNETMRFKPGTDFAYNNSGFVFLAVIIEVLTGDYHQWIQKEVLDRANMKASGSFRLDALPANTAMGYKVLDKDLMQTNVYHLPVIAGGDGGLFVSVDDMIDFWKSLFNGKIIHKDLLKDMLTPYHKSDGLSYGLGLWLEQTKLGYIPIIIGEDCGVSFQSGYNPYTEEIYTVISNTQTGAWPLIHLYKKTLT
jgi:CubicO group peptidase (beta-lactamase class C family)